MTGGTPGRPAATGTRDDARTIARDLRHVVAFTGLAIARVAGWLLRGEADDRGDGGGPGEDRTGDG